MAEEIGSPVDDEWIRRRFGVTSRRFAGAGESVAEMAARAGEAALAASGISAEAVGGVILASCSQPTLIPYGAASVAALTGIPGPAAFDLNAACSGFCYSLAVADGLIRSGAIEYALVIAAGRMRDWADPTDPMTLTAEEREATDETSPGRGHRTRSGNPGGHRPQGRVAGPVCRPFRHRSDHRDEHLGPAGADRGPGGGVRRGGLAHRAGDPPVRPVLPSRRRRGATGLRGRGAGRRRPRADRDDHCRQPGRRRCGRGGPPSRPQRPPGLRSADPGRHGKHLRRRGRAALRVPRPVVQPRRRLFVRGGRGGARLSAHRRRIRRRLPRRGRGSTDLRMAHRRLRRHARVVPPQRGAHPRHPAVRPGPGRLRHGRSGRRAGARTARGGPRSRCPCVRRDRRLRRHHRQPPPDQTGSDRPADGRAIAAALDEAALEPTEVGYVNAHGTATRLSDAAETQALKTAFGAHARGLAISSTKSMLGHSFAATGAVEAAVCSLACHHQRVPPTINLSTPDPACDLDYVPNTARDVPVWAAISTAMGFGGHNSALAFRRCAEKP